MKSLPTQRTALIVGGSLAGLMLGALLLRQGWMVRIFERTAVGLESRGTAIASHDALFTAFERAGVRVDDDIGLTLRGRTVFSRSGEKAGHFAYPQILCAWSTLYRRLVEAVPRECYELGRDVADVVDGPEGASVSLVDGEVIVGDLLVGADGTWSKVRASLNANEKPKYVGYVAWRGLVDEQQMPMSFREAYADITGVFVERGGQFLHYTLAGADDSLVPGRRRFGFLWYQTTNEETELPALLTGSDGVRGARSIPPPMIQQRHIDRLREQAVSRLPPDFAKVVQLSAHPFLQPIFDLASKRIAFKSAALIGDAAFVVRPHVGAGVLKAALDAVALADALASEPTVAAALRRYELERIPEGMRMVEKARHLGMDLEGAGHVPPAAAQLKLDEIIEGIGRV